MNAHSSHGFALPLVLCALLAAGILVGGALHLTLNATRTVGIHTTVTRCRLSAQTALDREKAETQTAFVNYFNSSPSTLNILAWFDTFSPQSIGTGGFNNQMIQNAAIDGCQVSVSIVGVDRSPIVAINQTADVTLRATASARSPANVPVTRVIEETVRYAMDRSRVFDYVYFINNHGWFMGGGVTANGDIRANGDLDLDGQSWINGYAYAAANDDLGWEGSINGIARFLSLNDYWDRKDTRWRPTSPTHQGGNAWAMGYDDKPQDIRRRLHGQQEPLPMPFLGDLQFYQQIAAHEGGTIRQQGRTLVDAYFDGPGPSGLTNGADRGCLVLDGTDKPIRINGPVVVEGDVIIKGKVTGQGTIYSGRNIHIIGDLTYVDPPSWPKPDPHPEQTAQKNAGKDMLGLAAKGNIVIGDYTASSWMERVEKYITPPWVREYACDPSDASIGYPSVFGGDYAANDGGRQIEYKYNDRTRKHEPTSTTPRTYYQSSVGDWVIQQNAQNANITQIDAVLYNNHATMGRIGECRFNGAMVCRDEALIYIRSVQFNWDIRLGSYSRDAVNISLYLPVSPAMPRVIAWQEVQPGGQP
ncbi:MAG TPA: hypothetical protein P5527_01255 [Kiritimatiellia bacterium]|nr:hypothetical protein [Kiritimatiellia bacterium]